MENEKRDVFEDYKLGLNKVRNEQEDPVEKQEMNQDKIENELNINDKVMEGNDINEFLQEDLNVGGVKEQEDDGMFDVEEDKEKEKEELEVEREIEERLAEVFKVCGYIFTKTIDIS